LASFVSVAVSRLRLEDRARQTERERRDLERRLARAQRLDTVGVLAGGVAHDFNNLLTVLMAATSLARGATAPGEIERELDAIEDVVERGAALTRQLLAMGRTQVLELTDLELGSLLDDFVPLLRRVIPASITIDLLGAHHGLIIEADKTQLEQVVMNLCLNARDAMPDGGRITIETEIVLVNGTYQETHPWAKPGRYALLTVTDTGHGIPRDQLDRIFDPFFTTKGEHAGTGLGLSVTHGIVQQHGGMLHCYSEVGIGTTFKIYLPLLARCARLVGSKIEARVQGGHERILVGEDDLAVRGVVRRILERAGYQVTLVCDGLEACRIIQAEPFDLVLLDVVMPGPSCTETIARLRELRPAVRILLASGYTADTNVAALLREQNVPLLPKPYDPDRLLRAIRTELERS
jgi:nitrogen-specific signal transduction histidine kinase/CheY-like chemotaxis protein